MKRTCLAALAGVVLLSSLLAGPGPALGQDNRYQLMRFYYYPYYYYPHNYWPTMGPRYPERPSDPYQRPPAWMAYPPFHEPNWRYDLWQDMRYYRGSHYWLDQF